MGRRKTVPVLSVVETLQAKADEIEAAHAEFSQRYREAINVLAGELASAHDELDSVLLDSCVTVGV